MEDHSEKVPGRYESAMLATLKCKAEHLSRIAYYEPKPDKRAITEPSVINDKQTAFDPV